MATFDLVVTISGLIVFVPRPEEGKLHAVLLAHSMPGPEHVHYPCLMYDEVYGQPDAPTRRDFLCYEALDRRLVNLTNESLGQGDPIPSRFALPEQIVSITSLGCGGLSPLPPEMLKVDAPARVAALVVIDVGAHDGVENPNVWETPTGDKLIATALKWRITLEGDEVEIPLDNLAPGPGSDPKSVTLYPKEIDGERSVEVFILNATCRDLPPTKPRPVQAGKTADHFDQYFEVLGKPGCAWAHTPRLKRASQGGGDSRDSNCPCKTPDDHAGAGQEHGHLHPMTMHTETCVPTTFP